VSMEDEFLKMFLRKEKDICTKLIESGIWKGVDSNMLKAWTKNFSTPKEQFFAACVLDWLVYRNEDQVVSMLYDLLTYHLHNQWRIDKNSLYVPSDNPLIRLQNKYTDPGFRYVTAVTHADKDTKSGYLMVRLMNQKLNIPAKWNIKIADLQQSYSNKKIRTFVFVDDITGTGEQICNVLKEAVIGNYSDAFFYVLICAAHEKAISKIKSEFPRVKILYAELIPDDSNFFSHVPISKMKIASVNELKEFYVSFMKEKGFKKQSLGRGDLGLLYAFQHNVPNNSLPILYGGYEPKILLNKLLNKRG